MAVRPRLCSRRLLTAALLIVDRAAAAPVSCPDGWDVSGGSCYKITSSVHNYAECASLCIPGGLVCIQNDAENRYLASKITGVGHFIGFADQGGVAGEFTWDEACEIPNTYTKWALGKPSTHLLTDCAVMPVPANPGGVGLCANSSGYWNDFTCDGDILFHCACEYNPGAALYTESQSTRRRRKRTKSNAIKGHTIYTALAVTSAFCVLVVPFILFYAHGNSEDAHGNVDGFKIPVICSFTLHRRHIYLSDQNKQAYSNLFAL